MATRKRRPVPVAVLVAIGLLFSGSLGRAGETAARLPENLTTIDVGAPVYGLAFSPRGDLLATAGKNGVKLWAVDLRRETVKLDEGAIPRPEKGWLRSDRSFDGPVFSPDGTLLAAAEYLPWEEGKRESAAGRYCVWDVDTGTLRAKREFRETLRSLAFSPDGARLAFGDSSHGFGCCEIPAGAMWHQRGESRTAPPTAAVAFSPDGSLLAVADDPDEGRAYLSAGHHVPVDGADCTIRLIDPTTKKTLREMSAESSQGLHVLAFAPDGKTLYAAYEDGHLRAWDVGSGELVKSYCIQPEPWYFTPIALSCDGKWLAVPDRDDGPVVIWDLVGGRKANVIHVSTHRTDSLALSTGALRLAAADPDDDRGIVSLWTAAKGGEYHADGALQVRKADGYRGIWYQCGVQGGPYRYKYSGGLGTYCAKHRPLAVYAEKVNKTFFCYGGTDAENGTLLHVVSYYDHATGTVPRPTILLDKHTTDAHDNPVMSIDAEGRLWIFSSAHGTARPAYVSVSKKPYDIEDFERVWVTNFSYPQPHYVAGKGFLLLHTRYGDGRRLYQTSSRDGRTWSEPALLAAINWGHYQVSGRRGSKIGTAFNYHRPHPSDESHWRTNLYYMETDDFGRSWHNAAGEPVELPLVDPRNLALVHDYEKEGLDVYMKDVVFDSGDRPVILYLTSGGNEAGPKNDPRTWRIARWTGSAWEEHDVLVSDNNYDTGSLYIEGASLWRLIGPTEPGPQRYNTGGEVALWTSTDQGARWNRLKQLTHASQYNHTYCRRPEDADPGFYAFWADGHGLEVSPSRLYFTDREGTHVWRLPETMQGETARPEVVW